MSRFTLFFIALAAMSVAFAATASASRADIDACDLISPAQLKTILAQQHVGILADESGTSSADNTSGVTHSYCNGVAYSGAQPKTPAGVRHALANGTGAGFAIDTWVPDEASADVDKWTLGGFADLVELVTDTSLEAIIAPGLPLFRATHIHVLTPVGAQFGGDGAAGAAAIPRNMPTVRGVGGAWWSSQSTAFIAIGFETSAKKATVKRLNRLAQVAVTAFGLKPLPLH